MPEISDIAASQTQKFIDGMNPNGELAFPLSKDLMDQLIPTDALNQINFHVSSIMTDDKDLINNLILWLGTPGGGSPLIDTNDKLTEIRNQINVIKTNKDLDEPFNEGSKDTILAKLNTLPYIGKPGSKQPCNNITKFENIFLVLYIYLLALFLTIAKDNQEVFNADYALMIKLYMIKYSEAQNILNIYEKQCNNLILGSDDDSTKSINDKIQKAKNLIHLYTILKNQSEMNNKTTKIYKDIKDQKSKDMLLNNRKSYYENIELDKIKTYLKIVKYSYWFFFVIFTAFVLVILKESNNYIKMFLIGKMLLWGLLIDEGIYYSKILYDFILSFIPIDIFTKL